jgi:hypothetical protein
LPITLTYYATQWHVKRFLIKKIRARQAGILTILADLLRLEIGQVKDLKAGICWLRLNVYFHKGEDHFLTSLNKATAIPSINKMATISNNFPHPP